MMKFAVFLRGVNVGGINLKMADLRSALATLPLHGVKTLMASGNIVCSTDISAVELKSMVEKLLRESFGYDAWVVVLDHHELAAIIANCPYPADSTTHHAYVTLSSDPAVLDELSRSASELAGVEAVRLGPAALAWQSAIGATLENPISKLAARPKYKSSTTTRNVRTLLKCRDAMA